MRAKSYSRPETRERKTQTQLSKPDVRNDATTFIYTFLLYLNARPITLWPISLGHFKADRRIGFDIEPCDCVIPLPAALHTAVIVISYTLFCWVLGFNALVLFFFAGLVRPQSSMWSVSFGSSWEQRCRRTAEHRDESDAPVQVGRYNFALLLGVCA